MQGHGGWLLLALSMAVATAHAAEPAKTAAATKPMEKVAEDTERLPAKTLEPVLKNERRIVEESAEKEADRRVRSRRERIRETGDRVRLEPGGGRF